MQLRNRLAQLFWVAVAVLLLAIISSAFAITGEAAPAAQDTAQGKSIFTARCVGCHTIGGGASVGPDLKGVTTLRTTDWLTRWLTDPPGMVAQKDPTAVQLLQQYQTQMPNLGLAPGDISALLDYLADPTASTVAAGAAQVPAQILPGDAWRGRNFFTGGMKLTNGGEPCMACHTVSGIGGLGGGSLGPDLTPAFTKYGEQGLADFLATYPLPTMKAVWTAIPLTPEEGADLRVFLQQASTAPPPADPTLLLAGIAIALSLILLVLVQFYWRNRLVGVRRPLLKRTLKPGSGVRTAPRA